ncbi:hypothetical protein [Marispirochaeta sp.]|uniref:hypothetical protein n=1 Tax=Marispirochaeta sp. TaxID=2038653 RepID=UPI0029C7DC6A|nr:hypothetical protein [Marispirochaeta sp.]
MHIHNDRRFNPVKIIPWIIFGIIGAAFLALVFGFVVMLLWNWLMPQVFGLSAITYWQAWGMVLLTHILFKSGPHHNGHHNDSLRHKNAWKEKFMGKFGEQDSEAPLTNGGRKDASDD